MVFLIVARRTSHAGLCVGLQEEWRQKTSLWHHGSSSQYNSWVFHKTGEKQQVESSQSYSTTIECRAELTFIVLFSSDFVFTFSLFSFCFYLLTKSFVVEKTRNTCSTSCQFGQSRPLIQTISANLISLFKLNMKSIRFETIDRSRFDSYKVLWLFKITECLWSTMKSSVEDSHRQRRVDFLSTSSSFWRCFFQAEAPFDFVWFSVRLDRLALII